MGSLRVINIQVQSPTPHAPPLPAYFGQFSQPDNPLVHELLGNGFQSARAVASTAYTAQAGTHY